MPFHFRASYAFSWFGRPHLIALSGFELMTFFFGEATLTQSPGRAQSY
jgi:hypothetical protein